MEAFKEITDLLATGGWITFYGLGTFLGYKLAFTGIISLSVVNVVKKIIDYLRIRADNDQKLVQLAAKAGMTWPLNEDEWFELNKRVERK